MRVCLSVVSAPQSGRPSSRKGKAWKARKNRRQKGAHAGKTQEITKQNPDKGVLAPSLPPIGATNNHQPPSGGPETGKPANKRQGTFSV